MIALLVACGGKTESIGPTVGCGERPMIEGVCVGVSGAPICAGALCTDGVACARVVAIENDEQLQRHVSNPGDCLALSSGVYGSLRLGEGVSVLGRGHHEVMLRSISAEGNTVIRGVSATSIRSTGALTLDRVMVEGSDGAAVQVTDGALVVDNSTVRRGTGPGLFASCKSACLPRKPMRVRASWIDAQQLIGVWGLGVDLDLRDVVITGMLPHAFLFGRGLEISNRSTVRAAFVRVEQAADVAMLVNDTTGELGPGIELIGGARGLHLSAIPEAGLIVDGFRLDGIRGVAAGIDRASRGVVLRNGSIEGTRLLRIPIDVGGQGDIGDGVAWTGGSEAAIESSVTISESARRAAVIHPSAIGSFAATLLGDDAARGVVVRGKSASEHPALTIAPAIRVDYSTGPIAVPPGSAPP